MIGIDVIREEHFIDHHPYSQRDWRNLSALFERKKADLLITTKKDLIRMDKAWIQYYPLYCLDAPWEIKEDKENFFRIVDDYITSRS